MWRREQLLHCQINPHFMKVTTVSSLLFLWAQGQKSGAEPQSLFLHPSPHILLEGWEEASGLTWLRIALYVSYCAGPSAGWGWRFLKAEIFKCHMSYKNRNMLIMKTSTHLGWYKPRVTYHTPFLWIAFQILFFMHLPICVCEYVCVCVLHMLINIHDFNST